MTRAGKWLRRPASVALALASLWLPEGCRRPEPAAKPTVTLAWRPVADWSGHGNYQTDSFSIGTGQWRIRWRATERPASGHESLRVDVHSSVSGRFVKTSVDRKGPGGGEDYVAEDPRDFFLVIDSEGLDWSVSVAEGTVEPHGADGTTSR